MPCRRATSCAIAPQPTTGYSVPEHPARWNAVSIPVPRACVVRDRHASPQTPPQQGFRGPQRPASYPDPREHPGAASPAASPARSRSRRQPTATRTRPPPPASPAPAPVGLKYRGTPGTHNAITDVPGVEVGYRTLIEGDNVRTGVTAIHPRGKGNPGDPVAAGYHSLNGNGEMTGVSWIEESGTCQGPIAITNTHAVGIAHAGIIAWMNQYHADLTDVWLLPVAAETWDGYLNDINGHHVNEETVVEALESATHRPARRGLGRRRHRHELLPVQGRQRHRLAGWSSTTRRPTPSASSSRPTSAAART